ncbi:MAG TPA: 4-(cytidine 5'-diphospho)-2-C-methyl-D-erythritol kinase [Pirellulales bacterium]|jgi:4-diphosphocytidyl-2-C-methyl-D-erythritol kinase|nr:4-(cytidine 5'-diphospho)-2-C-methyl-D-erythritol kinase [Pirellulales bacterium]
MNVHRLAANVAIRAPAKLNLFCEILAKRGDGYHEIETLMVSVSLFDTLLAAPETTDAIRVDCRWAAAPSDGDSLGHLPSAEKNLAFRAVALLRSRAGLRQGISLQIIKRIPAEAGLGGASSDAAAALLAANAVWNLNWSREQLAQVAGELGSDIPFFVGQSGSSGLVDAPASAAVCRGRGEQVEGVFGLVPLYFVIVRPPVGLSTAEVYRHCQAATEPRALSPLLEALVSGDQRQLGRLIHNRLQPAAESLSPWIGRLKREFAKEDCLASQMSGSGTSYFGICRHARHARRVARRLRSRGLGRVFAVSTCR